VPSYLSGARLDMVRYRTVLNYTTEQYHAVVALYATTPDTLYFFSLYILEVLSMIVFIGSWGAVRKERWAVFYGTGALLMAFYWFCYETQQYTRVTLLDNGESFLCVIPYLSVYTRAFGILHLVITSFYYGLALGRSSWRIPFLPGPHGRDKLVAPPTTGDARESETSAASSSARSLGPGASSPPLMRQASHSIRGLAAPASSPASRAAWGSRGSAVLPQVAGQRPGGRAAGDPGAVATASPVHGRRAGAGDVEHEGLPTGGWHHPMGTAGFASRGAASRHGGDF